MSQLLKQELAKITLGFLKEEEYLSLLYHDIFDYPLSLPELIKWRAEKEVFYLNKESVPNIVVRGGYYFLEGREGLILKRALRKKTSRGKLAIAKRAASIIGRFPTVKMVAATGALCMGNCQEEADIDLLIVTSKGTLWTTRILVYLLLKFLRIPTRSPKDKNQKNKLCLNMWLDEADLIWRKRNIFTAHEIAQIVPLANKDKTYEKFLWKNRWIKDYWPNAVKIKRLASSEKRIDDRTGLLRVSLYPIRYALSAIIEPLARRLQFRYMKGKRTREKVSKTRALFHPVDWGKYVELKLKRHKTYIPISL